MVNIQIFNCVASKINILPLKCSCLYVPLFSCLQDSVRIRTEEGLSLLICPEKHYSEDFEPYESVNMEVE